MHKIVFLALLFPSSAAFAQTEPFPPGQLWRHSDAGAGWTPRSVSIGANSSQVFTEIEYGFDKAMLFSAFDQGTAVPAWSNPVPMAAANTLVDSAEDTDTHVSVHQIVLNGNSSTKQTVVSKYTGDSATPDWTYAFPVITPGFARIGISADGQRILAVSHKPTLLKLDIAVFAPNSGVPLWAGEINFGTSIRAMKLAANGSMAYFASGATAYLWNVTTHTSAGLYGLPGGFDCHAFSGDGSVFAFGEFNKLHIFERQASGSYLQTMIREIPGSIICTRVDVSADSSTVAAIWDYYSPQLRVRVEAIDLETHTVTMFDEAAGTGTYQNAGSDISLSEDGGRFAAGLWGDEGNVCPELRIYSSRQNAPLALYNLSGSVMDLDMSADGKRVAVASKAVHANQYAGGGEIGLYAVENDDLRAQGVPDAGGEIRINLAGAPNSPAFLPSSPQLALMPTTFVPIGTLFLRRELMSFHPMGETNGIGRASLDFELPALVGSTLYFQGFTTIPRRLSEDWLRVTTLP